MKNAELIKVLRCELYGDDECDTSDCPIWSELGCRNGIANRDAADALEAADERIAKLEKQIPKEGEWINEQRDRWIYAKCNLCGKVQDVRSNYCPNCGARMQTVTDCHTLEEGER